MFISFAILSTWCSKLYGLAKSKNKIIYFKIMQMKIIQVMRQNKINKNIGLLDSQEPKLTCFWQFHLPHSKCPLVKKSSVAHPLTSLIDFPESVIKSYSSRANSACRLLTHGKSGCVGLLKSWRENIISAHCGSRYLGLSEKQQIIHQHSWHQKMCNEEMRKLVLSCGSSQFASCIHIDCDSELYLMMITKQQQTTLATQSHSFHN
jgi:hypothetical protein